jgi:hypothetical protein
LADAAGPCDPTAWLANFEAQGKIANPKPTKLSRSHALAHFKILRCPLLERSSS